jgi:hypothetical protein
MPNMILGSIVSGVVATALMDLLWALILVPVFKRPKPNWGLVGRWFAHLTRGTFVHEDIAAAEPWPNELAIGWAAHYAVGVAYGFILYLIASPAWRADPTPALPVILSLVLVGAGWFVLQPGMGAGIASSKRANRWTIRGLNLLSHLVFGIGLWLGARLVAG